MYYLLERKIVRKPEKAQSADKNQLILLNLGLAGLAAAFYLVRDGQVKGQVHHSSELAGGSCTTAARCKQGFYMRGEARDGQPL